MIDYREHFKFTNDVGEFDITAHTEEHPSDYGNGTLLRLDIESDFPCQRHMSFDVRYAGWDIASVTREIIKDNFGVEV